MASMGVSVELYEAAKKMRSQGEEWKETIPSKLRHALSLVEEVGKEEDIKLIVEAAKTAEPLVESNVKMYEAYFEQLIDCGRFLMQSYESMQGEGGEQ